MELLELDGGRIFFLRAIAAHPEEFALVGLASRNPDDKAEWAARRGVANLYSEISAMVEMQQLDFVVVSVPPNAASGPLETLTALGVPVLLETPAATDLERLLAVWYLHSQRGAFIEVAEQYFLQPMHVARLALVPEGLLREIQLAHN